MFVIRNSARAFGGAALALAAYHLIWSSIGLASFTAENSQFSLPVPDKAFIMFVRRIAIDMALLAAGHRLLRSFGITSRFGYGLMGGAMMATGYAFALNNGLLMMEPLPGARITGALVPALVGIIVATMYAQFAGREFIVKKTSDAASESAARAPAPEIYTGPVQVRTSMMATLIASVTPAVLFALCFLFLFAIVFPFQGASWRSQIQVIAVPSYLAVMVLIVTAVPAAILVNIAHGVARMTKQSGTLAYAGIGAAVGLAASLAAMPVMSSPSFVLGIVFATAVASAVYRRFAGLEPRPLPEAVIAYDPTHLVPEDHPTRHGHAVIRSS